MNSETKSSAAASVEELISSGVNLARLRYENRLSEASDTLEECLIRFNSVRCSLDLIAAKMAEEDKIIRNNQHEDEIFQTYRFFIELLSKEMREIDRHYEKEMLELLRFKPVEVEIKAKEAA